MAENEHCTTTSNTVKEIKITCTISELIQDGIENILRYLFFWESDDKKIGMMIQLLHHAFIYGMILWYIYLHTFSDSYLQFVVYSFIFFLIWIQHLFCKACLIYNIEVKLIGNHPNFIDNILHIFHITPSNDVSNGVLLLVSSLIMGMLGFELLFRTIVGIKNWF